MRKGQLLVEVLIGIGILAILVSAVLPLILTSTAALTRERKSKTADMLAREQIEALRAIKEQDWNNIYFPLNGSNKGLGHFYHVAIANGSWALVDQAEQPINLNGTDYIRYVTLENVYRTGSNGSGDIAKETDPQYGDPQYEDPSTQKVKSIVTYPSATPIVITEYLTRWANSLWTQTDWTGGVNANWQNPPGNTYASLTNIDPLTTPEALLLAKTGGGTGEFGNKFLLESTSTIGRLNSTSKRADMRFTAQKNATLSQVRLYINEVRNSGAIVFRLGIQADNSGLPTGVYLGSGTASFNATGWQTVNLGAAVNLTAQTTYHFVVQYDSGATPQGNRYIDIRNSSPWNKLVPFSQAIDNNSNTLSYDGVAWTVQDRQPIFVLGFNDNTFEGNPYDTSQARAIHGVNFEGEKFTVPQDITVSALSLYIAKNANQNPAAALRIVLRDLSANTDLIDDSSIVGNQLTTSYAWKTITLAQNKTMISGHQFRLYLSSTGSAANRHYRIYNESNPNDAAYNSINWDGINSVVSRSTDSGNNWDDTNQFIDMSGYNFTTVSNQNYANSGDLTSSTFDVGKRAGFNNISWTASALPVGTTVKFQLASSNNINGPWDFFGPDGSNITFYSINTGENTFYGLSNNQYIRYKVFLETSDPQVTPILDEIIINYSQ